MMELLLVLKDGDGAGKAAGGGAEEQGWRRMLCLLGGRWERRLVPSATLV